MANGRGPPRSGLRGSTNAPTHAARTRTHLARVRAPPLRQRGPQQFRGLNHVPPGHLNRAVQAHRGKRTRDVRRVRRVGLHERTRRRPRCGGQRARPVLRGAADGRDCDDVPPQGRAIRAAAAIAEPPTARAAAATVTARALCIGRATGRGGRRCGAARGAQLQVRRRRRRRRGRPQRRRRVARAGHGGRALGGGLRARGYGAAARGRRAGRRSGGHRRRGRYRCRGCARARRRRARSRCRHDCRVCARHAAADRRSVRHTALAPSPTTASPAKGTAAAASATTATFAKCAATKRCAVARGRSSCRRRGTGRMHDGRQRRRCLQCGTARAPVVCRRHGCSSWSSASRSNRGLPRSRRLARREPRLELLKQVARLIDKLRVLDNPRLIARRHPCRRPRARVVTRGPFRSSSSTSSSAAAPGFTRATRGAARRHRRADAVRQGRRRRGRGSGRQWHGRGRRRCWCGRGYRRHRPRCARRFGHRRDRARPFARRWGCRRRYTAHPHPRVGLLQEPRAPHAHITVLLLAASAAASEPRHVQRCAAQRRRVPPCRSSSTVCTLPRRQSPQHQALLRQ